MAEKTLLTCPKCAKSSSYELNLTQNSGGSKSVQCRECYKSFTVYFSRGKIEKVK